MSDFKHLDRLLSSFAENGLPGCSCAVMRDGKLLYEGYYGYANLERQAPIAPNTVYRIYSMTKVVVCAAALILYERGKFLLHDPISDYLPEFRELKILRTDDSGAETIENARLPMLVKHAFTMSTGLPYPNEYTPSGRYMKAASEQLKQSTKGLYDLRTEVKLSADVPLAFEPGEGWLYGYSHDVLGALIEVVSGMPLGQFLRQEIFEPLAMRDTDYRFRDDIAERMATCYMRSEDGSLQPFDESLDFFHRSDALYEGGGIGLYSTLHDYSIFAQMLACGGEWNGIRILGGKTIDLMRANHLNERQLAVYRNSYRAGYGFGLGVRTMMDAAAGNANVSAGEFGWSGLAGTWVSIDPAERASVVYMHQQMPHREEYYHLRVRAAAYGALS